MVKADSFGISLHGVPDYVGFTPSSCRVPCFETRRNTLPSVTREPRTQASIKDLHQIGTKDRSQSSSLSKHIDDHPVVLPRLQLIQS
jgi:hypothetical protein